MMCGGILKEDGSAFLGKESTLPQSWGGDDLLPKGG